MFGFLFQPVMCAGSVLASIFHKKLLIIGIFHDVFVWIFDICVLIYVD